MYFSYDLLVTAVNLSVHFSYQGHKHSSYKVESCLNNKDTHVFSGSEDGKVFIWDLVEVSFSCTHIQPLMLYLNTMF